MSLINHDIARGPIYLPLFFFFYVFALLRYVICLKGFAESVGKFLVLIRVKVRQRSSLHAVAHVYC